MIPYSPAPMRARMASWASVSSMSCSDPPIKMSISSTNSPKPLRSQLLEVLGNGSLTLGAAEQIGHA